MSVSECECECIYMQVCVRVLHAVTLFGLLRSQKCELSDCYWKFSYITLCSSLSPCVETVTPLHLFSPLLEHCLTVRILSSLQLPSPSSSPSSTSSPCISCSGYLGADEEYIVVPTTFGDGKLGSFVVSVTSTSDFSFIVEKK